MSAERHGERVLEARQRLLEGLTSGITEWVVVLDAEDRVVLSGGAAETLLGTAHEQVRGAPFMKGVDPRDRDVVEQALLEVRCGVLANKSITYRRMTKEGRFLAVTSKLQDHQHNRDVGGVVVTTRQERKASVPGSATEELLPGRSAFLRQVQEVIDEGRRKWAVLILDVTNFQHVAAGLGQEHAQGLIDAIAVRLREAVRPEDSLAQVGPREIAVFLEGVDREATVRRSVDRLRAHLRAPFLVAKQEVVASLSVGFATSSREYRDAAAVLIDAAAAAQRAAGARPRAFRSTMRSDIRRGIALAAALPKAFQRKEFQTRFQPIVALDSGTIIGFEALIRWLHPEFGMVSPGEFIPLAEQLDWIVPLDRWMLEASCRDLARMRIPSTIWVGVNISARHLDDPELVSGVAAALSGSGLPKERLHVEITETAFADNERTAREALKSLRELGIALAIDDFGTGYASFGQLSDMQVDILKIDGSFVAKLAEESGRKVVHGLIKLAQGLDLKVVAEGVETQEQLTLLRGMECDYAQGYFFAKPVAADEAEALMAADPIW